jgi:hypothetical protein
MALIALIISIVALMVAIITLPTIFQMIWGRPKLMVRFDVIDRGAHRWLIAQIFNYPIKNRFLRLLGVRTEVAEDVNARVIIKEGHSQKVISSVVADIKTYTGLPDAQRICLPASIFPAAIGIVEVKSNRDKAIVYDKRIHLKTGSYSVSVEVVSSYKTILAQGDLLVTDNHPFIFWDDDSRSSIFNQNLDIETAKHIT